MDILNELRTFQIVIKLAVCLLGVGGMVWGAFAFPFFQQRAPVNRMASEILKGRGFGFEAGVAQATQESLKTNRLLDCDPSSLHSELVVRLDVLDPKSKADTTPVVSAGKTVLACAPSDSFAWLTLFWADASKRGLTPINLDYLRMSYAFAPNESAIALWRNRIAISLFAKLPQDLADKSIGEFVKLVDTGNLFQEMASLYAVASPDARSRIVTSLKSRDTTTRQIFARELYDRDLDTTLLDHPLRPWR